MARNPQFEKLSIFVPKTTEVPCPFECTEQGVVTFVHASVQSLKVDDRIKSIGDCDVSTKNNILEAVNKETGMMSVTVERKVELNHFYHIPTANYACILKDCATTNWQTVHQLLNLFKGFAGCEEVGKNWKVHFITKADKDSFAGLGEIGLDGELVEIEDICGADEESGCEVFWRLPLGIDQLSAMTFIRNFGAVASFKWTHKKTEEIYRLIVKFKTKKSIDMALKIPLVFGNTKYFGKRRLRARIIVESSDSATIPAINTVPPTSASSPANTAVLPANSAVLPKTSPGVRSCEVLRKATSENENEFGVNTTTTKQPAQHSHNNQHNHQHSPESLNRVEVRHCHARLR